MKTRPLLLTGPPASILAASLLLSACSHPHGASVDYPAYGGNKANNRYSPLRQIDLTNVARLQLAWIYNSADTAQTATASTTARSTRSSASRSLSAASSTAPARP